MGNPAQSFLTDLLSLYGRLGRIPFNVPCYGRDHEFCRAYHLSSDIGRTYRLVHDRKEEIFGAESTY